MHVYMSGTKKKIIINLCIFIFSKIKIKVIKATRFESKKSSYYLFIYAVNITLVKNKTKNNKFKIHFFRSPLINESFSLFFLNIPSYMMMMMIHSFYLL